METIQPLDRRSFILGMITAFCECVAGGCKRLALSPPMKAEDFERTAEEAFALIRRHGLVCAVEENPELPEAERFRWILIAARPETLDAYHALRAAGHSPALSLAPFHELLSYRPEEGVHTGYDASRALFP